MKAARILCLVALSLSFFACQKEAAEKESVLTENKSDEPVEPTNLPREKVAMSFEGNVDSDEENAVVQNAAEGTKTSLDGLRVRWSDSDNITIFAAGEANEFLVKKVEEGGKSATFQGYAAIADTYYALSPVQETASISGNVISAVIEKEQTAVADSFGAEANVSIAQTGGSRLNFKNVGSLFSITLGDNAGNDDITDVEIASKNGTPLTGQVQITYNDGTPQVSIINGSPFVRLSGDFEKGKTYYFVVLPGTHSDGITLTFYKPDYKATFNSSKSLTIARNKHKSFGTFNPSKWTSSDFAAGANVFIDGPGSEEGQKMSYITFAETEDDTESFYNYYTPINPNVSAHWGDEDGLSGTYNYEMFTHLTAGKAYYFRSGNHYYQISGGSVVEISSPEAATATVGTTGEYRIRLGLPDGDAYIKRITQVKYYYCRNHSYDTELTYVARGVWSKKDMPIRISSGDNRYRFCFTFEGPVTQHYASVKKGIVNDWNTSGYLDHKTGEADDDTPRYWYLQPCVSNSDYDPKFKFTFGVDNRYIADLSVYMNDDQGHFTHAFTNIKDTGTMPSITAGEGLTIQNSAEEGQEIAYVGSYQYWNSSIEHSSVSNYPYDYEIFTRLTAGQAFYFQNADRTKVFSINAAGNALVKKSESSYNVTSDGVYFIQFNSATGSACIRKISKVELNQGWFRTIEMTYAENGTWKIEKLIIKRGEKTYENRYKFLFTFSTGDPQWYGRTVPQQDIITYGGKDTSYFNTQPADTDKYEPGFYFDSRCRNETTDRYYGDVTLYMNNDKGHYTHRITNFVDTNVAFTAGDKMYIGGEGADEAGQEMAYVGSEGYFSAHHNEVEPFTSDSYEYEIFTRLVEGKNIYFYSEKNAYFVSDDGSSLRKSGYPTDGSYTVTTTSGIYRIRANFSGESPSFKMNKVNSVSLYYSALYAKYTMVYQKKGTWKLANYTTNWAPQAMSWGADRRYHFVVNLQNGENTVDQNYSYLNGNSAPKPDENTADSYFYVQPTNETNNNWNPYYQYPNWLYDQHLVRRYSADIYLYLNNNAGHYTHEFANKQDGGAFTLTGAAMTTEGGSVEMNDCMDQGTTASPVIASTVGKYEVYRYFDAGDLYIQHNDTWYELSGSLTNYEGSGSVVSHNAQTQAFTITSAGIYRLTIDVTNNTWTMTRLDHPQLLKSDGTSLGNLTYQKNGVWEFVNDSTDPPTKDWTITSETEFYVAFWKHNSGWAWDHTWGGDSNSLTKWDNAFSNAFSNAFRYTVDGPWCWKTSSDLIGKTVNVKFYLNHDNGGRYCIQLITKN